MFLQPQLLRETKSAAYYADDTRFASFVSFFSHFDRRTDEHLDPVLRADYEALEACRKRLWVANGPFTDFYTDTPTYMLGYFDRVWERLSGWFPGLPKPELFIVDSPASVFSGAHTDWDAMCVERGDRSGVPPGVYFSRNRLTHLYFEFLIAHELLHWVIGETDLSLPDPTGLPIMEEGVCDFLAMYLMQTELSLPDVVMENLMLYNRAYVHHNSLCKAYWFALQNTARYVRSYGISGLPELIRTKGRAGLEVILERHDGADAGLSRSENRLCESVERVSGLLQLPLTAFGALSRSLHGGIHAGAGTESPGEGWAELTDYGLVYGSEDSIIQPNREPLLARVRYYLN